MRCSLRIEVASLFQIWSAFFDADLVFDVFFCLTLTKPELRNRIGLDKDVFDYVMNHAESEEFYQHLAGLD